MLTLTDNLLDDNLLDDNLLNDNSFNDNSGHSNPSPPAQAERICPVSSFNEWDPLEEVIVGRLDGAVIPPGHVTVTFNVPRPVGQAVKLLGGLRYPRWMVNAANRQLEGFIKILETAGVKVRRPDPFPFKNQFATPNWKSRGFCVACPRDGLLVLGDEIIETPMAWRSRFFESLPYKRLFLEYFQAGARWTSAPKPALLDSLFDNKYIMPKLGEPMRYVINESEPVFDAADMLRCGKHIFYQLSNVTNRAGVEWLRRHVEGRFELVEIESRCLDPMHIDATFMLLAPGKALVNPEYIDVTKLPKMFKSWDIIVAPEPDPMSESDTLGKLFSMCSKWIALNVLNLDQKRIVVEQSQVGMQRTLREHGFEPIPCEFVSYLPFGGAFHCATLDIRRRGTQQNYF
jgi:glycine amidinotransferase